MTKDISVNILSDIITYMKYSRYLPNKKRRENWTEIVDRNKEMHLKKFPKIKDKIEESYKLVYDKKILPSSRSLQFAGKAIEVNPSRLFNCCAAPASEPEVFSEIMFLLLSGCGVGYSVQHHHIKQLPEIYKPKKTRRHLIEDSIEGWSDAVKVLIDAYMGNRSSLPRFDFSFIRPKGTPLKTSGGLAPGPEDLKTCLHYIQKILDRKDNGSQLGSIEVHDLICHLSDCVLSGGIRRSALISLFSLDDEDMLTSKYNKWYEVEPQRARANNSAVLLRHKITENVFKELWKKIENSKTGEPGFIFVNDKSSLTNPCVEIGLNPYQFCNLCTIDVSNIDNQEDFNNRAKMASRIGTMQAAYTDFHYLREIWKETTEKEALLGVSMTGIAAGKILELDLKEAVNIIMEENETTAKELGINRAARCTTVKPEGTSSLLLGCSSGIHSYHSPYYIRRLRVGKDENIYKYLLKNHSELVEDDYFKPQTQAVISVPVKSPENAIFRSETTLQLLNRVKKIYKNWIEPGHRDGLNTHNVSCTVSLKDSDWDKTGDWMWENRDSFVALSVLPYDGGTYVQAPFEEIDKEKYTELVKSLKEIDLTKIKETEDNTKLVQEPSCSGGYCEIV